VALKKYGSSMSFMDLELKRIFGISRTQQFLSELEKRIDWKNPTRDSTLQVPHRQIQ